jgi:electron transfer flavoprotein alpha/beta subunit
MGIIQAARKQIPVWTAQDIQADTTKIGPAGAHTEINNLFIPVRESTCEIITADTPAEAAVKLAEKLREIKVI